MSFELKKMLKNVLEPGTMNIFEDLLDFCANPFFEFETEHTYLKYLKKMICTVPLKNFK